LPLEEALKDDVLLVHTANGRPLPKGARRSGADDHAAAVCLEGRQVDPADRVSHRGPKGILGAAADTATPLIRGETTGTRESRGESNEVLLHREWR